MTSHSQADSRQPDQNAKNITRKKGSRQSLGETAWTVVAGLCLLTALVPLFLVIAYVLVQGFSRLDVAAFTRLPPPPLSANEGGFANALAGTLIMVAIGALISVPFGVLAAIYLAEFSSGQIPRWIRFATNVLSGVPSILMGVFIYGLLVLPFFGFSAIAGGAALAVLMLPIIVRTTDESLQIVPQSVRWASLGMGASKFQTVLRVVLPAALPAIATGLTLAVARAAGETAPLIFTALFAQYWTDDLLSPIASLSVLVYNFAAVPYENQRELAWAASLILVLIVLLTSILSRWATRKQVY
ncbi:phosphate ABC transporter permease PstA [Romeria aff. gracilis LEGE 07310]|uniref:Phosphate transport system permease protein PstA n=1 Tax=Vasconcelosia minhoensis LEGE 07310 TaxID=915328 RepID=A0A8J7ARC7_9CYAN|nr:phosphate ABC transporter permease PstA [Romeria gracilis]MBE9079066.1 phosphate ABC transporter permease PstA [Romeria aff. gracilis LEGE 07310]